MTIKEMYECDYYSGMEPITSLLKWYNTVIDKNIEEINVGDVCRMLRQNMFKDIAIPKAIDFLIQNPFAGELFEGELLETIFRKRDEELCGYYTSLKEIIDKGLIQNKEYDWLIEEQRKEFGELLNGCSHRLENMQHTDYFSESQRF